MKFCKNRLARKSFAFISLFIMMEAILQPTISLALTTGPHQPEYISYEQPGATDMVNLLTGDFAFSLPILEVPGPEGSFSVPLTYNAGIGLEQEASWCGLGFNINVGSITREINQYPDDASGEFQTINMQDLTTVRGWTSAALGLGQIGWNNVSGHYGAISLLGIVNATYDNQGLSSGGLIGINHNRDRNGGVTFDAVQFANAVMTIASFGAGSAAEGAAVSFASIAKQAAVSLAVGAVMSSIFSPRTPGLSTNGYWAYNKKSQEQGFLHKDYWIWLDQTRNEEMYGILNLDQSPVDPVYSGYNVSVNGNLYPLYNSLFHSSSTGVASDINYYIPMNTSYKDAISPSLLATDNFNVKGPGISGSIKPYRLEVGSVAMPLEMTSWHHREIPIKFESYKVPFVYEGGLSSNYLYHTGHSSPVFGYNINAAVSGSVKAYLDDQIFQTGYRFRQDVATNFEIPQANHIEWLKNIEIMGTTFSFSNGYMDYFSSSSVAPTPTRSQFRQAFSFGGNFTYYSNSPKTDFLNTGNIPLQNTSDALNFQLNQAVTLNVTTYNSFPDLVNHLNGTVIAPQSSTVLDVNNRLQVSIPNALTNATGTYFDFQIITSQIKIPKSYNSIGGFSITAVNGLTYHYALPTYDRAQVTTIVSTSNSNQSSTIGRLFHLQTHGC